MSEEKLHEMPRSELESYARALELKLGKVNDDLDEYDQPVVRELRGRIGQTIGVNELERLYRVNTEIRREDTARNRIKTLREKGIIENVGIGVYRVTYGGDL